MDAVESQKALNAFLAQAFGRYSDVQAQGHRHAVQDVFAPLTSFRNSRELTKISMDTINTIFLVHDTAGILHGDINIGNIMIDANGEGVLCDLDDFVFITTGNDQHAPLLRTGTWPFMAIDRQLGKTHDQLRHDVESASVWVPLYTALHFLANNELYLYLDEIFDHVKMGNRTSPATGGHNKRDFLFDKEWEDLVFDCKPLDDLFRELLGDWSTLYAHRGHSAGSEAFKSKLADLTSQDYVIEKFKTALLSDGWPEADVVNDQYPPMTESQKGLKRDAAMRAQIAENARARAAADAAGNDQVESKETPPEDGFDSPLTDWSYDSDGAPCLRKPSVLLEPSPTLSPPQTITRRTIRPAGMDSGRPAQASSQGAGTSDTPGTAIAPAATSANTQKRKISQVGSTHSPKLAQKGGNQKTRKGKGSSKRR